MISDSRNKKIKLLAIMFLGLLLVTGLFKLYASIHVDTVALHPDEDSHLYNAFYYKHLFVDRDISSPEWQNFAFYDQPPVAKYVIGLALHAWGDGLVESVDGAKNWHQRALGNFWLPKLEDSAYMQGKSDEEVAQTERLIIEARTLLGQTGPVTEPDPITESDVIAGRTVIFIFEILAVAALIFLVLYVTKNTIVSLVAALLFMHHPLTIPVFQTVYTDSIWCFFVLTSILSLLYLLESVRTADWRKTMLHALLLGTSLALAVGTKLIAVYMAAVIVLLLLLSVCSALRGRRDGEFLRPMRIRLSLISLAVVASWSFVIFVAINPFLYKDTVSNSLRMFEHRESIMDIQLATQGPVISTVSDRISVMYERGILGGYAADDWVERALVATFAVILVLGLVRVIVGSVREFVSGHVGTHATMLVLALVSYAFVALTVHMDWERYFLPLLISNALLFSVGAHFIFGFFRDSSSRNLVSSF